MSNHDNFIREDSINSEELLEKSKLAIRNLLWTQNNNLFKKMKFTKILKNIPLLLLITFSTYSFAKTDLRCQVNNESFDLTLTELYNHSSNAFIANDSYFKKVGGISFIGALSSYNQPQVIRISSYVDSRQIDEYVNLSIILDRSNLKFDGYIELDKKKLLEFNGSCAKHSYKNLI